jgi:hypothetical protein
MSPDRILPVPCASSELVRRLEAEERFQARDDRKRHGRHVYRGIAELSPVRHDKETDDFTEALRDRHAHEVFVAERPARSKPKGKELKGDPECHGDQRPLDELEESAARREKLLPDQQDPECDRRYQHRTGLDIFQRANDG